MNLFNPKKNGPDAEAGTLSIVVETVSPAVDAGRFPVKWIEGKTFRVQAEVFKEGFDLVGVSLKFRMKKDGNWNEVFMKDLGNDYWEGCFTPEEIGRWFYQVEAWADPVATWLDIVRRKMACSAPIEAEVSEGEKLFLKLAGQLEKEDKKILSAWFRRFQASSDKPDAASALIQEAEFLDAVKRNPLRERTASSGEYELTVERERALAGSWYEMFARSGGTKPRKSATFRDCIKRLPDLKRMGFDVVYLAPIHPIGVTNRKGPNNSLAADKDSPGCPWAIGSKDGGHKSLHPELGTWEDFEKFKSAAREHEIELALDFAMQCSPDHPYVKAHPDWFYRLPDGTIRCAENPPFKYEDTYPLNFLCDDWRALWDEMKSIVLFWIEKGVKIFRVDNPHTKPFGFWEWLIREVQAEYPEAIFLAEAFTKPHPQKFLSKIGFTQSYTYFTWRNTKDEMRSYLTELNLTDMVNYYRSNFFANTHDVLPVILQKGGLPAFKMRYFLAGTLSASAGIYSGYELCENKALHEGSEEYLDSEKYEYKVRDWDAPGNIKDYIARVNLARRQNPALQQNRNLEFLEGKNPQVLAYAKWSDDRTNVVVAAVNMDPLHPQEDTIVFPFWKFGIEDWQTFEVHDLMTGLKYPWKGPNHYVRLDPAIEPAHLFRLKK